jgi:hypothetical protein
MTQTSIVSNTVDRVLTYGLIRVDTRIGLLEYGYTHDTSGLDTSYNLLSRVDGFESLTDTEIEEIDMTVGKEMFRSVESE